MFVEVRDVVKHYGQGGTRQTVLDGLSVDLAAGEIICLLGPSGSGKSTLLNIIGGIERADGGTVRVGDREITALGRKGLERYRRTMLGFVFQFYNLIPNLTVRENILSGAYLAEDPLDVDDLIGDLGLADHAGKFPAQLSGGQQQRCSLGRALAKKPRLLLCDEPTGALDYSTSKEMLGLIQEVNATYGTTILMATHNTAIAAMCHRMISLREGLISHDEAHPNPVAAGDLEW